MKTPDECRDMSDIRAGINSLGREIVALLGRRARYVRAAASGPKKKDSTRISSKLSTGSSPIS